MRENRDCFHKIIAFQNHKNCNQLASICENKCQKLHLSNSSQQMVDASTIYNQYKKIKSRLIESIKHYRDKFTKEYQQLMKMIKKMYEQSLLQMQKQLLDHLKLTLNLNKDILDKIQNQRLEKLRCNEINSFLQNKNIESKINNAHLLAIYEKYSNSFRAHNQQINFQIKSNSSKLSTKPNQNIFSPLQHKNKLLKAQLQRSREQLKLAIESKNNLDQYIKKLRVGKRQRLSLNTWNILKVVTKKRIKRSRKQKDKAPEDIQTFQLQQTVLIGKSLNEAEEDSEDILDYMERRKKE